MRFPREIMILILEWKSKFEVGARFKANAKKLNKLKDLKLEAIDTFHLVRINDRTTFYMGSDDSEDNICYTIRYIRNWSNISIVKWVGNGPIILE